LALEKGVYSEAIRSFEQANSLDRADARTHFNPGTAYEALHNEDRAIAEYQSALELRHNFWPSSNNLGRMLIEVRGRPDSALSVLLAGERQAGNDLGWAASSRT